LAGTEKGKANGEQNSCVEGIEGCRKADEYFGFGRCAVDSGQIEHLSGADIVSGTRYCACI
jgi:hypothetical protein